MIQMIGRYKEQFNPGFSCLNHFVKQGHAHTQTHAHAQTDCTCVNKFDYNFDVPACLKRMFCYCRLQYIQRFRLPANSYLTLRAK